MMLRLICMTLLVLWCFSADAQKDSLASSNLQNDLTNFDMQYLGSLNPFEAGGRVVDLRYEGVKGTPLLFDDWVVCRMQMIKPVERIIEVEVVLNLTEQRLFFRSIGGKGGGELPLDLFDAILFTEQDKYLRIFPENEIEGGNNDQLRFYEVMHEGEVVFMKSLKKLFREADYRGAYSPDRRFDEYVYKEEYFIGPNSGPFTKVRLKEKLLLKALPDQADELKDLIRESAFDLSTEAGVTALLEAFEHTPEK